MRDLLIASKKNNCRCTTEGSASTFKNELVRRKTVRKKTWKYVNLKKMREKDFKLFQQEQDRIEGIFLDEISTLTYNKREIR